MITATEATKITREFNQKQLLEEGIRKAAREGEYSVEIHRYISDDTVAYMKTLGFFLSKKNEDDMFGVYWLVSWGS